MPLNLVTKKAIKYKLKSLLRFTRLYSIYLLFLKFKEKINKVFGLIIGYCIYLLKFSPDVPFSPHSQYYRWLLRHHPRKADLEQMTEAIPFLKYQPLISVIMPVYNSPLNYLEAAIESVINQIYLNWELCIADDASTNLEIRTVLEKYAQQDSRIKTIYRTTNGHISACSNSAIEIAAGEFLALLDHDDLLSPDALYQVALELNKYPDADMIYSDEDKINERGWLKEPFFKPDWSPDLLQCFMYIGHLTIYRASLIREIGGFDSDFDFSQDYDLALRVSENTNKIIHIPSILYHWRILPGSASSGDKPFARESNIAALTSAMKRLFYDVEIIEYSTANRVKFKVIGEPLVSIIIPTDSEKQILVCLEAILSKTAYNSLEILVVTNFHLAKTLSELYSSKSHIKTIIYDKEYNFSAKCNAGVLHSRGEYILFLNDDVSPLECDWVSTMLGMFQQKDVGAVSPKLTYQNNRIQHAGMVTGVRGLIGTAFHQERYDSTTYFNLLQSSRTVSVLSAACLMMPKKLFLLIHGFDEKNTPIMGSDVDLCFKIREKGYRLVYTPFSRLQHIGHATIEKWETKAENLKHSEKSDLYLLKKWGEYLSNDPYYPKNMRDFLYKDSPFPYQLYAVNGTNPASDTVDVLLVSHDLTFSGAPLILYKLVKSLTSENYFFTLISPENGSLLNLYCQERFPIVIDSLVLNDPSIFRVSSFINNFDIIIANTILSYNVVIESKALRKKVIWMIHEGDFGKKLAQNNLNIRRAFKEADAVIFPSKIAKSKFIEFETNYNFHVINCGIDSLNLDRIQNKYKKNNSQRLSVAFVGSIEKRKGQDIFINALKNMPSRQRENFDFYFVGRILDSDFYSKLLIKTKDFNNVHWLGELTPEKTLDFISTSDILVCCSIDETGPLVVIEAMALKKVVISTPVGIVPEIIVHSVNGLIIDLNNPNQSIIDNLLFVYQNVDCMQKISHLAYQTYCEKLTINRYANDINQLIKRV